MWKRYAKSAARSTGGSPSNVTRRASQFLRKIGCLTMPIPNSTSDFPDWIEPMAATLTQERFVGPDWTFERRFDGIRLIAFKRGGVARLFSRTRNEKFLPGIAAAIAAPPVHDLILDGEVEWDGRSTNSSKEPSGGSGAGFSLAAR